MAKPVAEAESFETFYSRAWRDAARWATALTGNMSTGEEIAQDAFVALSSRYESLHNADGYLRITVVNLARSALRANLRRTLRERRVAVPEGVQPLPSGELLASLDRLSYDQRAVLVLRYWADWDESQIAEALGCRPNTVRSHAHRALALLRTEIER